MADTEGFEPSKDREALASLAGRWFQPLTHVSTQLGQRWRYNHAKRLLQRVKWTS